jgi:hypothetical protein
VGGDGAKRLALLPLRSIDLRMRQAALLLYAIILTAVGFVGCSEGRSHNVVATVLAVRGEVVSASRGTDSYHPVNSGDIIAPGSAIRVPSGSELDIALLPGLLMRVAANSEFIIEQLTLIKDGNETQGGMVNRIARIRFNRGAATISFQLPEETPGRLAIETSHVTINSGVDCLLRIDTDANVTRAICVRGNIQAADAEGRISVLEKGSFQRWGAGTTAARPTQTDAAVLGEADKAVKTEAALLEIDPPATFHVR